MAIRTTYYDKAQTDDLDSVLIEFGKGLNEVLTEHLISLQHFFTYSTFRDLAIRRKFLKPSSAYCRMQEIIVLGELFGMV